MITSMEDATEVRPRCDGCGREIDPDTCHCGSRSGECGDHDFRPMGCDCDRSCLASTRVDVVGVDLGSRPDFTFLTVHRRPFLDAILGKFRTHDAVYVETEVAGRATPLRTPVHPGGRLLIIDSLVDFERAPRLGLPLYACRATDGRHDDRVGLTAILAALAVGRLTAAQLARFAA